MHSNMAFWTEMYEINLGPYISFPNSSPIHPPTPCPQQIVILKKMGL